MKVGNVLRFGFGIALVLAAVAVPAVAEYTHPVAVPEIGIGSLGSAVTLLSGGFLVLTSRLLRRKQ